MKRVLRPEWREQAHEHLDKVLDRYEEGWPLWIGQEMGWWGTSVEPGLLVIEIREPRG